MKPEKKKILEEALQLEPTTRAFIAETLLESLDFEQDFTITPEWLEEIHQRVDEIDQGKAALTDNKNVINELREKYT